MKTLAFFAGLVAVVVLGFLSGWAAGLSGSAAISALLPLLFGIVTAFITGLLSHINLRRQLTTITNAIKEKKPLKQLSGIIQSGMNVDAFKLIASGSVLVIILCIATFLGVLQGSSVRNPKYSFKVVDFTSGATAVSAEEYSLIYKVFIDWESKGISQTAAKDMLADTVQRLYSISGINAVDRKNTLKTIVDYLTESPSGSTPTAPTPSATGAR